MAHRGIRPEKAPSRKTTLPRTILPPHTLSLYLPYPPVYQNIRLTIPDLIPHLNDALSWIAPQAYKLEALNKNRILFHIGISFHRTSNSTKNIILPRPLHALATLHVLRTISLSV